LASDANRCPAPCWKARRCVTFTPAAALQHPWLRHAYPEPAAEEEEGGGNGGGGGGAESFVV
jgi:hypothetical protein